MVKKARTYLTTLAFSIGLISLTLVLAISNGFNKEIKIFEEKSLYNYPLIISKERIDINNAFNNKNDNYKDGVINITNSSSMLVTNNIDNILLDKINNLDKNLIDVINGLQDDVYWASVKNKMHSQNIELFLPKFKTEYSKKLNDVLIDMGMETAFTPGRADFSRMSNKDAFISLVKQDTFMATDEVGTEAAAVTVVGVVETSSPASEEVVFKADKPFLYMIQENSTGSILFMGVVKRF